MCEQTLAIVLLFTVSVPIRATDGGLVDNVQSFVEWSINTQDDFLNGFWKTIFGEGFNTKEDVNDFFGGGASREDLQKKYGDYIETLPAPGYTSSGGLAWQPKFSDIANPDEAIFEGLYFSDYPRESNTCRFSVLPSGNGFSVSIYKECTNWSFYFSNCKIKVPVSGIYQRIESVHVSSRLKGDFYYKRAGSWGPGFYSAGDLMNFTDRSSYRHTYSADLVYAYFPVYEVIPDTGLPGDTYNINTRPTSITGRNYGIVGDNGQITKVEDNSTIINETNNTFYNPATGTTVPIVNWSYDYSDRSYKVILESGDTATITYGDENISIQETTVTEGDTITNNYTIYYLIDGSGSGPVDPPVTCDHAWTETNTTPATCTVPGSKLQTCSKCQQTKKDSIPALGHDWQVKQTVTTEYDDTGQLIQEGYTIYECSRCKEQYKAPSGTSPPTTPLDPDASGDGVFSGIFGLLLDFLGFFFKTFKDFTKSGVQAFLKALQDGTSDIFGLLNPFDWSA
ncbi:MAG: hypothetical protein HFG05_09610 [Oscillibacter sp.]|nr:hypothetical protein [Oscillibacter sp.]